MELTDIRELVDESVLKKFEYKIIDSSKLKTSPNSINFIRWPYGRQNLNLNSGSVGFSKRPMMSAMSGFWNTGFSSDYSYNNSLVQASSLTNDLKINFVLDSKLDLKGNEFLLLRDEKKNYFVAESINQTNSPNNENEASVVVVASTLENYCISNKFKIIILEEENLSDFKILIPKTLLLSEILVKDKNTNFFKSYKLENNNFYTIANPIKVSPHKTSLYFPQFKDFNILNINDFKLDKNLKILGSDNDELNNILTELKKIHKIVWNLKTGFHGIDSTSKEEFKTNVYGGNSVKEYLSLAIHILLKKIKPSSKELALLLIKMCSSFWESTYCVDGGITNNHKNILPFYFEELGIEDFKISSNFWNIKVINQEFKTYDITPKKINESFFSTLPSELQEMTVDTDGLKINDNSYKYLVELPNKSNFLNAIRSIKKVDINSKKVFIPLWPKDLQFDNYYHWGYSEATTYEDIIIKFRNLFAEQNYRVNKIEASWTRYYLKDKEKWMSREEVANILKENIKNYFSNKTFTDIDYFTSNWYTYELNETNLSSKAYSPYIEVYRETNEINNPLSYFSNKKVHKSFFWWGAYVYYDEINETELVSSQNSNSVLSKMEENEYIVDNQTYKSIFSDFIKDNYTFDFNGVDSYYLKGLFLPEEIAYSEIKKSSNEVEKNKTNEKINFVNLFNSDINKNITDFYITLID
ncbi:Uncharacterised protein [Mycoplasmopsis maculosa]|uniref:Uncharacterized protein n=1 Tax=Mycoplasmopsis maculosa TaxID=114885 RepID=A0A449B4T5_9BACT|nr:hypothetical protein [Mycoplasmopsis maculosa]VEU75600.1 Uncharacterised protein [Mycoplasmopsis maculosa]